MNKPITDTVAVSEFVCRQTPGSGFSYFAGTWESLLSLTRALLRVGQWEPGYRDGVVRVTLNDPVGFFCGVVEVKPETKLHATFAARRRGEAPYVQVYAESDVGLPASYVEIILYRHDVLEENKEASTHAEWEIISINARPTAGPEPLTPMAMARNFLGLPGGTEATYTALEFAEAIVYWSKRAMVAPK